MKLVEPRAIRTHAAALAVEKEAREMRVKNGSDPAALRLAAAHLHRLARQLKGLAKYHNHPPGCLINIFGYGQGERCSCGRDQSVLHPDAPGGSRGK